MDTVPGRESSSPGATAGSADHSVAEGIEALIADGKTYLEAEIAFQKSRAAFTGTSVKRAAIFGFGALALLHLALIGLVVGALLSLAAIVGFAVATILVVATLLLAVWLLASKLRSVLRDLSRVYGDKG